MNHSAALSAETGVRLRSYAWDDPTIAANAAATMSGLEFLRSVAEGAVPPPPLMKTLDVRLESVEAGTVVFGFTPAEYHYNPIGSVHGGVSSSLLDSAAGCAVHSRLPLGTAYTSIDLSVRFLAPIRVDTGPVQCTGTVRHLGSRVALAEAALTSRSGKLLATATSSCLLFAVPGNRERAERG
ncbi:PaaI family thioesterase [Nocardia stercoris]|uniref:PaaI family thioesterase n=1 Tax=Nocardia stercoris TaxID=2483361 RepID=UPI0018F4BE3E|nr:PaaI family thioesterase [Nocardia stercoris]